MKSRSILPVFSVLIVAGMLYSGCKNSSTNPQNSDPGNVKGKVALYDTNGVLLSDFSGVKVAMEGTSYSTLTLADGTWELQNVPAGKYPSLMYSKAGFPTYKSYQGSTQGTPDTTGNIRAYIIGRGETQNDGLQSFYQISNISVDLVLRPFDVDYLEITYHDTLINSNPGYINDTLVIHNCITTFSSRVLDNPPNKMYEDDGVLFFGKTPDIDPSDPKSFLFESCYATQGYYAHQFNASYFTPTNTLTGIADFTVNKVFLQSAGFTSGETVYCVAYFGNNYIYNNYYTDPATGMIVFPGFSPHHSEVKSFVLP